MNKEVKKELIKNLQTIAEKYYNEPRHDPHEFRRSMFGNGICYAIYCITQNDMNSYDLMEEIMKELGYRHESMFDDYPTCFEDWEPRAYMCLFLAEYLKGK